MTEEVLDPTEVLEPSAQNLTVVLGKDDDEYVLVQKPLSFFGKMEFFAVMGNAVEKALSDGSSIAELLDVPDTQTPISSATFKDSDVYLRAIAKLVQYAPEILEEMYVVILGVPRGERDYAKMRLEQDLTDDQGVAILNTFIDQNWEVMADFFKEKVMPLAKKVGSKFQESTSSKQSSPTQANTRKRSKNS